jgi:hypothetical protein
MPETGAGSVVVEFNAMLCTKSLSEPGPTSLNSPLMLPAPPASTETTSQHTFLLLSAYPSREDCSNPSDPRGLQPSDSPSWLWALNCLSCTLSPSIAASFFDEVRPSTCGTLPLVITVVTLLGEIMVGSSTKPASDPDGNLWS